MPANPFIKYVEERIDKHLNPNGEMHESPIYNLMQAEEIAIELFEGYPGEDILGEIGTRGQLTDALYATYSFEALDDPGYECECEACKERRAEWRRAEWDEETG